MEEKLTGSFYCWVMELWEFPDSELKKGMQRVGVKSLM